jgi:hypothetical protein
MSPIPECCGGETEAGLDPVPLGKSQVANSSY